MNNVWFGCVCTPKEIFLPHIKFEWNPPKFTILGIEFTKDLKNITEINIENKFAEMQREINNWSKRDLTPFGKVTVIKTLIISKIVHILLSLPSPNKNTFKKINKMLYEFLWDGKPDKIKRNIGKQKLEKGGIAMIDIELFDKALKITWIRRLLIGSSKWKTLAKVMFPNIENIQNFGNNFILNLSKQIENPFWENVMSYLYEFYNKVAITSSEELQATSFLYNEKFKIGGSVISNNILKSNNIFFVNQLMERGKCLNHAEFTLKYNIQIDFLTYHAITRTIGKYIEQNTLKTTAVKINNQPPIDIIL